MFITFKPINLKNASFGENHITSASGVPQEHQELMSRVTFKKIS